MHQCSAYQTHYTDKIFQKENIVKKRKKVISTGTLLLDVEAKANGTHKCYHTAFMGDLTDLTPKALLTLARWR